MDYSIDYLALAFWLIVGLIFLLPMYLVERKQNYGHLRKIKKI